MNRSTVLRSRDASRESPVKSNAASKILKCPACGAKVNFLHIRSDKPSPRRACDRQRMTAEPYHKRFILFCRTLAIVIGGVFAHRFWVSAPMTDARIHLRETNFPAQARRLRGIFQASPLHRTLIRAQKCRSQNPGHREAFNRLKRGSCLTRSVRARKGKQRSNLETRCPISWSPTPGFKLRRCDRCVRRRVHLSLASISTHSKQIPIVSA
jgi:hypothetical protein